MKSKDHQWTDFYSPRNGRISIEACQCCGVTKSRVTVKVDCSPTGSDKRERRLSGWTMNKPQSTPTYRISS